MSSHSDPRDASLETKVTLPSTWFRESADGLATSGMFLGGLIMVTRNRYLAWPNLLLAINGLINQHPLRTKESGNSPWLTLALAVTGLFASYFPFFTLTPTPLSTPLA
ncbi:hypothetical protein PLICRDRAFT_173546 [Plicaturopsis crispa FD-325 SS-3]|nr:hypothetical protein PLICRDRAFT_173546 [Plicaturopsis crispa FD-325 SS-3]